MASKGTPKKIYKKFFGSTICRLCKSVTEPKHSKNLFKDLNRDILRSAESIYGEDFQRDSALPHLICRPCERRVNNFIAFKNIICETQRSLREDIRTKRCIELLPSVPKPPSKVLAAGSSRCRSIDFNVAGSESDRSESVAQTVPLHVSLF